MKVFVNLTDLSSGVQQTLDHGLLGKIGINNTVVCVVPKSYIKLDFCLMICLLKA